MDYVGQRERERGQIAVTLSAVVLETLTEQQKRFITVQEKGPSEHISRFSCNYKERSLGQMRFQCVRDTTEKCPDA